MGKKKPRPLTDGYVRQAIFQRLHRLDIGFKKEDITVDMIELERAKLEGVRTLREVKKIRKDKA